MIQLAQISFLVDVKLQFPQAFTRIACLADRRWPVWACQTGRCPAHARRFLVFFGFFRVIKGRHDSAFLKKELGRFSVQIRYNLMAVLHEWSIGRFRLSSAGKPWMVSFVQNNLTLWVFPKIGGVLVSSPPNHEFIGNRVFDHFHHPFWGFSPYFWFNTHVKHGLEIIRMFGRPGSIGIIGTPTFRGLPRGWAAASCYFGLTYAWQCGVPGRRYMP